MKLRFNPEHDCYSMSALHRICPNWESRCYDIAASLTGGTGRRWWHGDSGFSCQNRSWHIAKYRMLKWSLVSVFTVQLVIMGTAWRRCSGTLHGASTNLVRYGVMFSLDVLVCRFVVQPAHPLLPLLTVGFLREQGVILITFGLIYQWMSVLDLITSLLHLYPKVRGQKVSVSPPYSGAYWSSVPLKSL